MKKFASVIIAALIAVMVAVLVTVVLLPTEEGSVEKPSPTQVRDIPQTAENPKAAEIKVTSKDAEKPTVTLKVDEAKKQKALARFTTARIDIKNQRGEGNDLVVKASDPKCTIGKPAWFNREGVGYLLQSTKGQIDIDLTCVRDGDLNVFLRGLDMHEANDNKKRIPVWIDYTKMTVNGETVFDTVQPICHDKPYRYTKKVVDGEKLTLHLEWKRHDYEKSEFDDVLNRVMATIK